jgi:hypothetical protein
MFERFTRKSLGATAAALLAAAGVGGVAIAQSGSPSAPPQKADTPAAEVRETPGQESKAPENSATDPDNVQDTTSKDSPAEAGQESSAEVPGDDGPGGHADEPGNPNADHQFQGVE